MKMNIHLKRNLGTGVVLLSALCLLLSAQPVLAAECLCADASSGDQASCSACVTFCGSSGRGGMEGYDGIGGEACSPEGRAIRRGGDPISPGSSSCGCLDGTTPPASGVTSVEGCCAACSTATTRAEGVLFNSVTRSCSAAAADEAVTDTAPPPPTRTPGEFGYVNPLGTTSLNTVINRVIRTVLGFVGALFLAMFVYAGVLYMTAGGDDKKVSAAKTTMVNAVLGILVISLAYSIISIVFETARQVRGG
jgi:hypothetical protein